MGYTLLSEVSWTGHPRDCGGLIALTLSSKRRRATRVFGCTGRDFKGVYSSFSVTAVSQASKQVAAGRYGGSGHGINSQLPLVLVEHSWWVVEWPDIVTSPFSHSDDFCGQLSVKGGSVKQRIICWL